MCDMPKLKILLIGESSVGKTSLLMQYSEQIFSPTFISTIGIDFKRRPVKLFDKTHMLEIWDTAGQERFQSLSIAYLRNGHGALLCFDITSRKSFERAKQWCKNLRDLGLVHMDVMLVGNKLDLQMNRVVSSNEARRLAADNGMLYIETSAMHNLNVNEAFTTLALVVSSRLEKESPAEPQCLIIDSTRPRRNGCGC